MTALPAADRSLEAQIDARPLSSLQWRVFGLCWLVNALDGFDLLAISFAAPAITAAWQLDPTLLGVVFSSGLIGMTVGSLLLGPAADRFGRRPVIVAGAAVLGLSTLATAAAESVTPLVILRALTGLAIGALLPALNTLVAEYAPARRRNFAIGLMHLGYPVGGIAGGLIATWMIPQLGWQALFLAGGGATLALLPILLLALPESPQFLLRRRRADTPAARRLALRLGIDIEGALPLAGRAVGSMGTLLRGHWLRPGLALWLCFLLFYLTLYFVLNWTPTVLTQAGLPQAQAIRAGTLLNLGGCLGMLALGIMTAKRSLHATMGVFFGLGAIMVAVLGQLTAFPRLLPVITMVTGFFSFGALVGLYALAASLYPAAYRATGVGLAIGAGRLGAILGPLLAGSLIAIGWPMGHYFALLAVPLLVAAFLQRAVRIPRG